MMPNTAFIVFRAHRFGIIIIIIIIDIYLLLNYKCFLYKYPFCSVMMFDICVLNNYMYFRNRSDHINLSYDYYYDHKLFNRGFKVIIWDTLWQNIADINSVYICTQVYSFETQ